MSSLTIKHGVTELLGERIPTLVGHIYSQWPRTLEVSKAPVIVIWLGHGREMRVAGSGRSVGQIHGVKNLTWDCGVHVVAYGRDAQVDGEAFETLVAQIEAVLRSSVDLAGLGDDPEGGSQVLNFGQNLIIQNEEPNYNGQFLTFQAAIVSTVEEIYNA